MSSEEFLNSLSDQDLAPLLQAALVTYSHHENNIRAHLNCAQSHQENKIQTLGFKFCLHEHYTHGGPHPHDYNLPLNLWNDTPN